MEDLGKMPVSNSDFFLERSNFERTKAIKYTLLVAIEDIIHICAHLVAALGLGRPEESSKLILLLGEAGVIPPPFAKSIVGMVNFRNKLAHEYLPDEFEAEKLYENLKRVEDFRTFSHHIVDFLETHSEKRLTS